MKIKKLRKLLVVVLLMGLVGCGSKTEKTVIVDEKEDVALNNDENKDIVLDNDDKETELNNDEMEENTMQEIIITSESLTDDGKWITVINAEKANPAGQNMSPQLSWNAVEGASSYAIYMYDLSAGNWLHWKAKNVKDTKLDLGAVLDNSSYVGPYPPSGTHTYEIIIYALKEDIEKCPGTMDNGNPSIEQIEEKMDSLNGKTNNIIGKGSIDGIVTVGKSVN